MQPSGAIAVKAVMNRRCCEPCSPRLNPVICCSGMPITQAIFCSALCATWVWRRSLNNKVRCLRSTDFRRGERLGVRDHLIRLRKPKRRPDWMTPEEYAQAPDALTVRELAAGGKILVTTLLCPSVTPKAALKALYRERWQVELDFRHIKTTLGMEMLSCKTPTMAQKEIWVYLLAYNLIRLMMAQAAVLSACRPRELSFKHTVQLWIAWDHYGSGTHRDDQRHALFILIAQQRVGNRPGRIEPRAIKRRPKPFPLLTEARAVAREKVRMQGHPRKIK